MKKLILLLLLNSALYAQVGVGTASPNAALQVSSSTNGILIPNVALTSRALSSPVVNPNGGGTPLNGTLVWNTATTSLGTSNDVEPGFYYWEGGVWMSLTGKGSKDWSINGNSGTLAGTNFIGTTDATDFRIKTNNTNRWNFSNTNNGQLQSYSLGTASLPIYSFQGDTNTGIWSSGSDVLNFSTNGSERARVLNGGFVVGNTTSISGNRFSSYGQVDENAIVGFGTGPFGTGVRGESDGATGFAVIGKNKNSSGSGILGAGNNLSASYLIAGSGGSFTGSELGLVGFGKTTTSGWGVLGAGNDESIYTLADGGGGSFTGKQWGVYGKASISGSGGTDRAAFIGNFNEGTTARTVYLGARIGGTNYKVLGTGATSVSTTMPTRDGERILFAPEAPENWFFDIGEVQLVNGKAVVDLDPIFIDCISDSKPFKVFVQGGENTLGSIRITRNQENKSFIVEDLGGASNGTVQYSVYAIWKQKENLRFPKYVQQFDVTEHKKFASKENESPSFKK